MTVCTLGTASALMVLEGANKMSYGLPFHCVLHKPASKGEKWLKTKRHCAEMEAHDTVPSSAQREDDRAKLSPSTGGASRTEFLFLLSSALSDIRTRLAGRAGEGNVSTELALS